jgi:two-component sensor histidine kinase
MAVRASGRRAYGIALAIFAIAVAARFAVDPLLPGKVPYITFFPAVILAGYVCGVGPGVVVVVLSAIAAWVIWLDETLIVKMAGTGLFAIFSGAILFLVYEMERARKELEERDEQLELINRELHHRIKNLFAITRAICTNTIRSGASADEMISAMSKRIDAVASAQELLSIMATKGASITQLVEAIVRPMCPAPERLIVKGDEAILRATDTTPFALVLNELATNALKYGAWSADAGKVEITWTAHPGEISVTWRETGGPAVSQHAGQGFGTRLITQGIPQARVEVQMKPDGLQVSIRLPPL